MNAEPGAAPTLLAEPKNHRRALLFSHGPLRSDLARLLLLPSGVECEVVARCVPTEPGEHRRLEDAVEEAKAAGVSVIVVPTDADVGPIPVRRLLDTVLPDLAASGIRLLALASGNSAGGAPFDSQDPAFLAGMRWVVDRPKPVRPHWPRCRWCHHPVLRAVGRGKGGHILVGTGAEAKPATVCSRKSCGCPRYEPENEALLGRA